MRMNKLLLTVAFTVAATVKLWAGVSADTDVKVALPPELTRPLSDEEKAREAAWNALSIRASAGLPYQSNDDKIIIDKAFLTLGWAVKQSSNIAVVSVQECEFMPLTEEVRILRLHFKVETNLFGEMPPSGSIDVPWALSNKTREQVEKISKVLGPVTWQPDPPSPSKGDRFLVFLSPKNLTRFQAFWNWGGKRDRQASPAEAPLFSFGDAYNVIALTEKKQTEAFLTAVSGYVKNLRDQNMDEETYYRFLKGQMRSPFPRLKEDARCEMVNLLKSSSVGSDQALNDEGIDDGIKEYVRLILSPDQTKKKP